MKATVYHMEDQVAVQVAIIDCGKFLTVDEMLEYAYHRTQNIHGSWSKGEFFADDQINQDFHKDIEVVAELEVHNDIEYGHRSSMMRDRIEIDGTMYEVQMFGFEEYAAIAA
jgi:hypothetical protein